jgi:hypothetical protein
MHDVRVWDGCDQPLAGRSNRRHHDATCRKRAERRRKREAARAAAPPTTSTEFDAVLERALSEPRLLAHIARAPQTTGERRRGSWSAATPERWGRGRVEAELLDTPISADDVFREVDELAERRRQMAAARSALVTSTHKRCACASATRVLVPRRTSRRLRRLA